MKERKREREREKSEAAIFKHGSLFKLRSYQDVPFNVRFASTPKQQVQMCRVLNIYKIFCFSLSPGASGRSRTQIKAFGMMIHPWTIPQLADKKLNASKFYLL